MNDCDMEDRKNARMRAERTWRKLGYEMPMVYKGERKRKEKMLEIVNEMAEKMVNDDERDIDCLR